MYTDQEMEWLLTGYRKRWPSLYIEVGVFNGDYRRGIVQNVLNITPTIAEALIIIGKDEVL